MRDRMQGQERWKGKKWGSCWDRQRLSHGIGKRKQYSQNDMYCRMLCIIISEQEEALENAYDELEVERNASATAMDEAMAVIWRLQNENARLAMEAAHLKKEVEHKVAYAQEALEFYEETLMVKDEEIRGLESEITSYRKRYGIGNHEASIISIDKTPRDPLEQGSYQESEAGLLNQDDVGFQDEESCVECDKFVVTHERTATTLCGTDDNDVLPWGEVQSLEKPSDTGSFLGCPIVCTPRELYTRLDVPPDQGGVDSCPIVCNPREFYTRSDVPPDQGGVDGCPIVCTPREFYSRLDAPPDQDLANELMKQAIYSFAKKQKDAGSQEIVGQESETEEECYRKAMIVNKLQSPKGVGLPNFVKSMVVGAVLGYVGKILTCRSR